MLEGSFGIQHPAREAHTYTLGGQHFMLQQIASKANQSPRHRKKISTLIWKIDAKLASIGFLPVFIQITNHRKLAMIIFLKLIEMAFVKTSGRINRLVDLCIF